MGNILEQECCTDRDQDTSVTSIRRSEKLFSVESDCEHGCLVDCKCESKRSRPDSNRAAKYELNGGVLKESVAGSSKRSSTKS